MSWRIEPSGSGDARVLLVSQRGLQALPSRALRFEFEDAVGGFDAADLLWPTRPALSSPLARRAARAAERIAPAVSAPFPLRKPSLSRAYDLLFVALESLRDLQLLHPFAWLLRRARTSICFVDEVWAKGLRERTGELRLLRGFDRVLAGTAGSVSELERLSGRPCAYLPPSVDATALCPYPAAPPRAIDVYSMGRRSAETHSALLDLADRRRWFYLYDTLAGSRLPDHVAHRRLLGGLLQRTRYFLAYPGKIDVPTETGGQEEVGFRYFEGAAAGALLLGQAPSSPWFETLFGWPDAVLHLPYGASEVEPALAALEADPARAERTRRRNVRESLLRHDHVYRWAEVLRVAGLPETTAMEERRRALRERAALVIPGSEADGMRTG